MNNWITPIFTLAGVIIGGCISAFVSYLISKQGIDLELKRMKISFLSEKISILESELKRIADSKVTDLQKDDISMYNYTEDTFGTCSKALRSYSHYFDYCEYEKLRIEHDRIVLLYDDENTNEDLLMDMMDEFNIRMEKIIREELRKNIDTLSGYML